MMELQATPDPGDTPPTHPISDVVRQASALVEANLGASGARRQPYLWRTSNVVAPTARLRAPTSEGNEKTQAMAKKD